MGKCKEGGMKKKKEEEKENLKKIEMVVKKERWINLISKILINCSSHIENSSAIK